MSEYPTHIDSECGMIMLVRDDRIGRINLLEDASATVLYIGIHFLQDASLLKNMSSAVLAAEGFTDDA